MIADEESKALIRLAHDDLTGANIHFEKDGPYSIICFHAHRRWKRVKGSIDDELILSRW